jgi:hypothetical protein
MLTAPKLSLLIRPESPLTHLVDDSFIVILFHSDRSLSRLTETLPASNYQQNRVRVNLSGEG